MTSVAVSPLHPSLQKLNTIHRRRLRLLGMLQFLSMAGILVFLLVTALTSQKLGSLLLLAVSGLVMLPVIALLGGLMWYLDHWLSRSLNAANQLLQDCTPQTAQLILTHRVSRDSVLVALHPLAGQPTPGEPVHVLINPSFRWSPAPRQEITVQWYCRALTPGNEWVALQSDGRVLLGHVVELEAYYRKRRWMIAALVAVIGIIAAVIGIVAFKGFS